jgi:hypothetical protein
MTAPTTAEIRAYGQAHGFDVSDRGKIGGDLRAQIVASMNADQGMLNELAADFPDFPDPGPDYDEGVTEADFPPDPEPAPETKPRRVRNPRGQRTDAFRSRIWGGKPKAKAKGAAKKRPRVATDRLLTGAWRILARIAAPVDVPVARVLEMQAPVAGVILDPLVKDTLVDTVLQPLARMQAGGETMFAMIGPPVLVGALHRYPQAAPVLVPALEEALVSWMVISGPAVVEAEAKRREFEERYGADVKAMIRSIYAGIPGFDPAAEQATPEQQAAAEQDGDLAAAQAMASA